jgi:penicillin-binding protein 1A
MLAGMTGVAVVFAQTELPDIEDNFQTSLICADDVGPEGCNDTTAMARLLKDEDRTQVKLADIPPSVINAVLAMEDRDFFEHDGVNPMGIARAAFQNIKGGGVSQGGSTITQQYVKNAFKLSTERAFSRKIKEAVLSIKLEQQKSKEEILEGYLNTIYFGRGAYGVAAAARAYFDMDLAQVTESEAALLAGLIRAPASAEPTKHPEEATRRRHTALVAMRDEGYLTDDQFTYLDQVPVAPPWIVPSSPVKEVDVRRGGVGDQDYMGTDYLSAYIREEVKRIDPVLYTDEMIDHGGLRIYTSINYDKQRAAWSAVTSTLPNDDDLTTPEVEYHDPDAALVSVDDQGLIRAMVGSRHQFHPAALAVQDGQPAYENNYAILGHEPGSTFKPLVLAEAIREQISLRSRFNAQGTMEFPEWKNDDGSSWKVSNYDESDAGVLDLMQATGQSSNTAYAQLMLALGIDPVDSNGDGEARAAEGPNNVAELAKSMGVGGAEGIPENERLPSMVLGSVSATPVQMAGVYSTFANRGWYKRPSIITRIEQVDQDGNSTELWAYQPQPTQVLTETQADLVTYALTFPVAQGGTAANANLGKDTAGKTGTSQENRNAWFSGFVPRLTTVVWMGYPETGEAGWDDPDTDEFDGLIWPMNRKGRLVQGRVATGGSFPATIWKKYMQVATEGMDDSFNVPTQQQINLGTVLHKNDQFEDQATTIPEDQGPGNGNGPPTTDGNGGGGGGGGGGPTFPFPTSTTIPEITTTTGGQITLPTIGPPRPNE